MYDFLIIGQGVAGSILALQLLKAGKKVFIIDKAPPGLFIKAAKKVTGNEKDNLLLKYSDYFYPRLKKLLGDNFRPKVIGGLITPVTGKRFTKTWLADTLLPYAEHFYISLEKEINAAFFKPVPIVRIFADVRQANDWDVRLADPSYNDFVDSDYIFNNRQIHYPHGYTVFKQGAVIDGSKMLYAFYKYFKKAKCIKKTDIATERIEIKEKYIEAAGISARTIIFCEGWQAVRNPLFKWLPFMPAKGELLIIKSPGLNLKEVINRGIFIRPLSNDLYLSGSTYSWSDNSLTPTKQARDEISTKLKTLIRTNFNIVEQLAGIRPTVKGRRPFAGQHPEYKNVYIFNGLGTKGLLLSPYFAQQLQQHLLENLPLNSEIDVKRFY
jgi:glycine oxidase